MSSGVGTKLKELLASVGISADHSGCACRDRARMMDTQGIEWCEQNVEVIVGWLEQEARSRKITLFTQAAARMFVKLAIRLAKREACQGKTSTP